MVDRRIDDRVIDEFLNELESLYHKYGLSLAHEDTHGAFIIQKFSESNVVWMRAARREAKYQ